MCKASHTDDDAWMHHRLCFLKPRVKEAFQEGCTTLKRSKTGRGIGSYWNGQPIILAWAANGPEVSDYEVVLDKYIHICRAATHRLQEAFVALEILLTTNDLGTQ